MTILDAKHTDRIDFADLERITCRQSTDGLNRFDGSAKTILMKNQGYVQEVTGLEVGPDDVFFTCKYCSKSLVIDCRAVGMQVTCPDCGERSIVPSSEEKSAIEADDTLQLTHDQRIAALSSALQGSHDEIRRLTTHLQEVP